MTQDEAYKAWWHNEGSGIIPLPNEDMEEFAHRMTQIAWSNGAFKEREACAKVCDVLAVHPEYASEITKLAALAIRARGQA
jgi:hypothetical protein